MTTQQIYEYLYSTQWKGSFLRDMLKVSETLKFREVRRIIVREYGRKDQLAILDYGCGRGRLASMLVRHGNVTGIDFSSEAIEQCRKRVPSGQFIVGDVTDERLAANLAGQFDVVVSTDVIEHLHWNDQVVLLSNMQLLKSVTGIAILTTPLRERSLEYKTSDEQSDREFLLAYEGQPIANQLTTAQLLDKVSGCFSVVSFQEVSPLIKNRALDLFLKAVSLPLNYWLLEIVSHHLRVRGKFAVLCLRGRKK